MKPLTRILIVEDNADDEALVLRELKKADMADHVMVIRDGAKALSFLSDKDFNSEGFAAVFLDLKLPKASGLKVLETIRKQERTRRLTVIIMTSSNSPEELERCRELGVFLLRVKAAHVLFVCKSFRRFVPRENAPRRSPWLIIDSTALMV